MENLKKLYEVEANEKLNNHLLQSSKVHNLQSFSILENFFKNVEPSATEIAQFSCISPFREENKSPIYSKQFFRSKEFGYTPIISRKEITPQEFYERTLDSRLEDTVNKFRVIFQKKDSFYAYEKDSETNYEVLQILSTDRDKALSFVDGFFTFKKVLTVPIELAFYENHRQSDIF
jgi:hypothetical protein